MRSGNDRGVWHRVTVPLLGAVAWLAAGSAAFAQGATLATERWESEAHGMSLRPPEGATLRNTSGGDPLLIIAEPGGAQINVSVRKRQPVDTDTGDAVSIDAGSTRGETIGKIKINPLGELTLDTMRETAVKQIQIANPAAKIVGEKRAEVDGKPALVLYVQTPGNAAKNQPGKVFGQAMAIIDQATVALLQLEVSAERFAAAQPTFEAVFNSLKFEDPKVLDAHRRQRIAAGQAWFAKIDTARLKAAIVPEQWFRFVENNADIGYMRVRQAAETVMGEAGITVEVQARVQMPGQAVDSLSRFFLSDDRTQEIWSINTTLRPTPTTTGKDARPPQGPQVVTWAETGVRSHAAISVNRQGPQGLKDHKWQQPPEGYLSQVQLQLLGPLLSGAPPGEMAFYAYYPNAGKVVLRIETIERRPNRGYVVRSRPTPDQDEQVSEYDSTGRLVKRTLPDGKVMLPATVQEMRTRWKVK